MTGGATTGRRGSLAAAALLDCARMSLRAQRARVNGVIGTALLHTPWLRRLGRISFLGTLDAHPRSGRPSTRLEHSIGVAALGAEVAETLELERERARVFVAACLLHDVGHYPLSHAAEPAFARRLGADHHELTRWILTGDGPLGEARSLRPELERLDIDPAAVWALIDGGRAQDDGDGASAGDVGLTELLRARINLDTLEGIVRVARCFRVRKKRLPARIFVVHDGELSIDAGVVAQVDHFWGLKDRVYDEVINLPSNILAEARLCEQVAGAVSEEVFGELERFDDAALERVLGEGWAATRLRADEDERYLLSPSESDEPILVRTRKRYFVDKRAGDRLEALPVSRWSERYQHEKVRAYLLSRDRQLELPGVSMGLPLEYEAPEI